MRICCQIPARCQRRNTSKANRDLLRSRGIKAYIPSEIDQEFGNRLA